MHVLPPLAPRDGAGSSILFLFASVASDEDERRRAKGVVAVLYRKRRALPAIFADLLSGIEQGWPGDGPHVSAAGLPDVTALRRWLNSTHPP